MSVVSPTSSRFTHTPSIVIAFGATVAMWIMGFIGRMPSIQLSGPVLFGVLIVALFGGGYYLGRSTSSPLRHCVAAGVYAALLNMLVLGSLLTSNTDPNQLTPSALGWIPGFILTTVIVMSLGGLVGSRRSPSVSFDWTALFTRVTASLTFFLLLVGGLVTSHDAGLAVPDWPNSYGYNMFLFPLSRMTGGIYYEHTHRLFGSLVGLTVLVLTVHLWFVNRRKDLKWFSTGILALVIVQGILGGLRVTGRMTTEMNPDKLEPNIYLAVAHGVLGQVVFIGVIALAVMTTKAWQERRRVFDPSVDRGLCSGLMILLFLQLIAGAVVRHLHMGETVHITGAVLVVMLAITCGVRAWGKYGPRQIVFHRTGIALMTFVSIQFVLGLLALVFSVADEEVVARPMTDLIFTSAHQAVGAIVLATAFALTLYVWRVLESDDEAESEGSVTLSKNLGLKKEAPSGVRV